jgi:phosphatidylglycerophosphatase A
LKRSGARLTLAYLVATAGNVGRIPFVPGTFGTLAAVPLVYLVARANHPLVLLAAVVTVTVAGVWAAGVVEKQEERTDPTLVVVDEVAGFLVTMAFLPATPLVLLSGFLIFRVLDVLKPPPAGWAEKFPGGFGIMADDLIVGVYANLILRAGIHIIGRS